MPLSGTKLSRAQVVAFCQQAGFSGNALDIAVAIAQAESSFYTRATNYNASSASTDRGIFQINNVYHPEVTDTCAFTPLCAAKAAYNISSKGTKFTPWSTFNNGAYKQYLSGASSVSGSTGNVSTASSNTFPKGQCTWWACERYHTLTGFYIPWKGNANEWSGNASKYSGWSVSSTPKVPSIVVLQAGVQLADSTYGHVAIAEKLNADGTVKTSDQNWAGITYPNTTYVNFKPGSGVSFVYALGTSGAASSTGSSTGDTSTKSYTPVLTQVHQTLVDTPGFYGMALALDQAEDFPGYIDLTDPTQKIAGVSLDIYGLIRSLGATITDNFLPFTIRAMLFLLGAFILYALILKAVNDVGEQVAPIIQNAAPLMAGA